MAVRHRAFALAASSAGRTVLPDLSHLLGEVLPHSPHPHAQMHLLPPLSPSFILILGTSVPEILVCVSLLRYLLSPDGLRTP